MRGKPGVRIAIGIFVVLGIMSVGLAFYARTRPRLAVPTLSERLQQVDHLDLPEDEPRGAMAALREFILDYPTARHDAQRLKLAASVAGQHDGDFLFVADQVEQVALETLADLKPGEAPTKKRFSDAGFTLDKGYSDWTEMFQVADVDGDGSPDVLLAYPGGREPGVCCLFRHAAKGWTRHRLLVGAPIMGMWLFDITPHGPKAIEIASLADSEYDPNLLIDVFVWQNGRIASVLSTKIPHGFQLDHKDVDHSGTQQIRLYGNNTTRQFFDDTKSQTIFVYCWDGSKFILQQSPRLSPTARTGTQWVAAGKEQLAVNHFQEAIRAFQAALAWKPPKGQEFDDSTRRQAHYFLGLCQALLGNYSEAVTQMRATGPKTGEGDALGTNAQEFLRVAMTPADLPSALAAIGQPFRILEQAARRAGGQTTPREVLTASGLALDTYQETDVTGDGKPDGLAQIHWSGGKAVVVLQRNAQAPFYALWILAYTRPSTPTESYVLDAEELFYLSDAPALQLHPLPTAVRLEGIKAEGGNTPHIAFTYEQDGKTEEGRVAWNGERVGVIRPLPKPSESFPSELNQIEASLFEKQDYADTLQELADFEARVRQSHLAEEAKTDLLLEAFYHEALCERKLGQAQKASVTYAALWRGHPDNAWGKLAKRWLSGK